MQVNEQKLIDIRKQFYKMNDEFKGLLEELFLDIDRMVNDILYKDRIAYVKHRTRLLINSKKIDILLDDVADADRELNKIGKEEFYEF